MERVVVVAAKVVAREVAAKHNTLTGQVVLVVADNMHI